MSLTPGPKESGNKARTRANQRQVSIMHVFRASAESGDSRRDTRIYKDGERELSLRSKQQRDSTDESTLRHHLNIDLANLMNTIRLDAIVPLDDVPYVEKSVLNYGFRDMSSLTRSHQTNSKIIDSIRMSLINHEPRLIPELHRHCGG